jgi:hypothetical protein
MTAAEKLNASLRGADSALAMSLRLQTRLVVADTSHGVFQAEPCQRGPKHNCELNISN